MERSQQLARMETGKEDWEVIVIGGGASGLGIALDSITRGYRTLLLERGDFAEGTSSRSTKLIHGGIRYLRQGHLSLVRRALIERARLLRNAPHLVHVCSMIIPAENWPQLMYYRTGVGCYDLLAGKWRLQPSYTLAGDALRHRLPNIRAERLCGGVVYFDGQFDDSRLAIHLAQSIVDHGGTVLNYVQVDRFLQERGRVAGVVARDVETGQEYLLRARVVVNAAGIFSDEVRRLEAPHNAPPCLAYSQGTHLVLPRMFFPADHGLVIPKTRDGRILFLIPWHERVLLGTTEVLRDRPERDPRPTAHEVDYLLEAAGQYLVQKPQDTDILARFAGIRALVKPARDGVASYWVSRDHRVIVSPAQLVSVAGGKWTTYRQIAQDVVDVAARVAQLPARACQTMQLRIHGSYGSDEALIEKLATGHPELLQRLHPDLPCRGVDVLWAVRQEMARTIKDILFRRTSSFFFDERASACIAPHVARLMACELRQNPVWEEQQLAALGQKKSGK